MSAADLLGLFGHFLLLSLLAIGGAITATPDMHRYMVVQHHWLTDTQFTASIAIGQAAPGPNILFVSVLGWNAGGAAGALATTVGILVPSTVLSIWATRWGARRREARGLRAFTGGLTPLTLGLLLATGWVLAEPYLREAQHRWGALALIVLTVLAMLRTRASPMWLVALGAAAGMLGLV